MASGRPTAGVLEPALAKLIIDALGGRIWATSRDGGGAIVGFALPIVAGSDSPD